MLLKRVPAAEIVARNLSPQLARCMFLVRSCLVRRGSGWHSRTVLSFVDELWNAIIVHMTPPDQFREAVRKYLGTNSTGLLLTTIPEGSGICHIANVPEQDYDPCFVSTNQGRWNSAGEAAKYFASNFDIASIESHYPTGTPIEDRVFELHRTTKSIDAIKVSESNLPQEIFRPLFEDKSPSTKWDLPAIFLEEVKKQPEFSNIQAIYAESASGIHLGVDGMCFVTSPLNGYTELAATGTSTEWKFGDVNYLES